MSKSAGQLKGPVHLWTFLLKRSTESLSTVTNPVPTTKKKMAATAAHIATQHDVWRAQSIIDADAFTGGRPLDELLETGITLFRDGSVAGNLLKSTTSTTSTVCFVDADVTETLLHVASLAFDTDKSKSGRQKYGSARTHRVSETANGSMVSDQILASALLLESCMHLVINSKREKTISSDKESISMVRGRQGRTEYNLAVHAAIRDGEG